MTNKTNYSVEQKREVLKDLVKHYETIHNDRNQALVSQGEGKYVSPFESIEVCEIKEWAYSEDGW